MNTTQRKKDVQLLNELLKNEIVALSTYRNAIKSVAGSAEYSNLLENEKRHHCRYKKIKSQIKHLGGEPLVDLSAWEDLKLKFKHSVSAVSTESVMSSILSYEKDYTRLYKEITTQLEPFNKSFIEKEILSSQKKTEKFIKKIYNNKYA